MPRKTLKRQRKQRGGDTEEQKLKTLYTTTQNYLEHDYFLFEFVRQILLLNTDNIGIITRYGVYKRLLECVYETKINKTQSATFSDRVVNLNPVENEQIHVAIHDEADSSYKYSKMFKTDLNCVFSDITMLGEKVSTKRNKQGHPELFTGFKRLFINDSTDDILTDNVKNALHLASIDNYTQHSGFIVKANDPFLGFEESYIEAMMKTFPDDLKTNQPHVGCFPWCPWHPWGGTRNKHNKRHKKTLRKK